MTAGTRVGAKRLGLLTDSPVPSGVGEHMLTLAAGLSGIRDIVVGARPDSGLLERAAGQGLTIKALTPDDPEGTRRWLAASGLDIAHIHAGIGWEGHALTGAAREAGIPLVLRTEHLPYLLTDPAQRRAHAAAMAALDRLICVSGHVAETYRAVGVDPTLIAVVRNGVAPRAPPRERAASRRELGLPDAPVLLIVGRFTAQKGHALLLKALPAVLARHPAATLLMAGDGPLMEPVAHEVAARGLAAAVRMLGARRDCADLMAAADLLVLPSRFEGLPLVLLEAMAAGLPVVATRTPGIDEAVEHGVSGWLSPAEDAEALARCILHALGDPPRLARVAAAARARHRADFTAERMTRETAVLYGLPEAAHDAAPALPRAARRGGTAPARTATRIGFIGAGGIARRHLDVLATFDDVAIAAICDTDTARAADMAARFGARPFGQAAAMLDAVDLDAVYICVPPFAHGAIERAVIARDLPFFVEKPVALDMATANDIAASVAEKSLVTAVGYHWRYLDTVDQVRALLADTPARLLAGHWLDATPPPEWWWHMAGSGGQMVEQTTHLLDLARWLAGDVVQAHGMAGHTARPDFPGLDVPTVSTANLRFASGAVGTFTATCLLRWTHRIGLHLFADGLAIELTDHDVMIDVGRGRPVRLAQDDPVRREDRDFIDAVRGMGNRIRCPYGDALATQALALAVVESARTGRVVDVSPAREPAHV